eukprot:CAMPEP_0119388688 /NCGR_PEP_ID=MMETSP1334-20130426/106123_1 /TAXON_ID=127549 /ORGANISM="Calcidiscus leptoporus, Strain RCC1130" /LENGTH=41 /DNA_ID= /DNA_START= /DNA_END= /DNA_ORIENTATION=
MTALDLLGAPLVRSTGDVSDAGLQSESWRVPRSMLRLNARS